MKNIQKASIIIFIFIFGLFFQFNISAATYYGESKEEDLSLTDFVADLSNNLIDFFKNWFGSYTPNHKSSKELNKFPVEGYVPPLDSNAVVPDIPNFLSDDNINKVNLGTNYTYPDEDVASPVAIDGKTYVVYSDQPYQENDNVTYAGIQYVLKASYNGVSVPGYLIAVPTTTVPTDPEDPGITELPELFKLPISDDYQVIFLCLFIYVGLLLVKDKKKKTSILP